MNPQTSSSNFVWDFYLAARAGWADRMTPGALTGALVFLLFLYLALRLRKNIKVWGCYLLAGILLGKFSGDIGFFDLWVSTTFFNNFLDVAYFTLAIVFLILGFLAYRDWSLVRRTQSDEQTLGRLSFAVTGQPTKSGWLIRIGLLPVGILLAFVESAWAPDSYVVQLLDKLIRSKFGFYSLLPYLVYLLIFLLPLWGGWFALNIFRRQYQKSPQSLPLSKVYIVASAIFFAYAIVLFSYYI